MAKGLDYAFSPHPSIAAIKTYGAEWVGRYVSSYPPNDTNGKNLIRSERNTLLDAGIHIILFVEEGANAMKGGRATGIAHAQHAVAVARALGMDGIPFYYACDYDAPESDQAAINAYMDGTISVHGFERAGIYGGYHVVKRVLDAGKAKFCCQTIAWSGGQWDHRVNIRQGPVVHVGGASCDADESKTPDYAQWPRPATVVSKPVTPPAGDKRWHGEYITGGMFRLAALADKLGWPTNTLLRMTAVRYGTFGNDLGLWINDVMTGKRPWTTPVPKGVRLWCD